MKRSLKELSSFLIVAAVAIAFVILLSIFA